MYTAYYVVKAGGGFDSRLQEKYVQEVVVAKASQTQSFVAPISQQRSW